MHPLTPPKPLRRLPMVMAIAAALASPAAFAASDVVISQVYGGGGNSGTPYQNDYIELFNRSQQSVSLNGWSLQYTSATGTGTFGSSSTLITPLPDITLQPGQYLLVQESGGTTGSPLPTPDVVDSSPILMSASGGKVALVNSTTGLGCNGGSAPAHPPHWRRSSISSAMTAPTSSRVVARLRRCPTPRRHFAPATDAPTPIKTARTSPAQRLPRATRQAP